MNYARIVTAAVVAWVVSIGIGFLVNELLLRDLMLANSAAMRPQGEMMAKLPLGFAFLLVGFLAFAYAYAKGYEGGHGPMEGVRFGVVVALVVIGFGVIWQYVAFPITGAMAAAGVIDAIVELAIYGAIVGAIYRPAGAGARRSVGA